VWKVSPPPGCNPQNVQCIASCYASYAIPDHKVKKHDSIKSKLEWDILLDQYLGTVIENYTNAQWARITRKLAKIIKLLVLIETHIFNKIKIKISKISIKFN
jgi:hypothetical protein